MQRGVLGRNKAFYVLIIAVGPERTESDQVVLAHFLTRLLWMPILAAAFANLAEATHVIGTFLAYLRVGLGLAAV